MKTQITLNQAIDGYLLDANARRLSPRTIQTYTAIYRRFKRFIGDIALDTITRDDVRRFLTHVAESRIGSSHIAPRPDRTPSDKTILNYHTALGALWTWAIKENFVKEHIVHAISRPEPEERAIQPYTRDDVNAFFSVLDQSQPYTRPGKSECSHSRPSADRDRAILLLLIDTGIRASELCADPHRETTGLTIQDVDLQNNRIKVFGKGAKERIIPISHRTGKAIWRYLLSRPNADPSDTLIIGKGEVALSTSGLYQLIKRLGKRAGIPDAHPHRFRHTFAVNFLRNGGNLYALQAILGHTTLEMVKRYVKLAETDVETAHRRASPVVNWNL